MIWDEPKQCPKVGRQSDTANSDTEWDGAKRWIAQESAGSVAGGIMFVHSGVWWSLANYM